VVINLILLSNLHCYGAQKYVDTFASTIGFWLFGYACSGNTSGFIAGEEQDYVFWFFRVSSAINMCAACNFVFL